MAEIVSSMAEYILGKLAEKGYTEVCLALGVKSDLKKLNATMEMVAALLLDAEEKETQGDKAVKAWLEKLKDVLYDADDVLDEFKCETLRRNVVMENGSNCKKVRRFFSSSNPAIFSVKMAHMVKDVRERLDAIVGDGMRLGLTLRLADKKPIPTRVVDEMPQSYVEASSVIGRDKDKEKIIDLLTQKQVGAANLSVIPIVGIGGMGKTTLARAVYNEKSVVDHFQLRMWVMVSEDFNVPKLMKEILISSLGMNVQNLTLDQMQIELRQNLNGRKFLLVVDNVWDDVVTKWLDLKQFLNVGARGSKIIVTTRQKLVADAVGTVKPYNLEGLSHEDSWSLFVKFAFKDGAFDPSFKGIGKDILAKCARVPLAIKTLGSLLRSKPSRDWWEQIRDKEHVWQEEDTEYGILPALRLSYNLMPSYLKPCFLYFALFPKGAEITSLEAIYFWMAHGLLHSTSGNQDLEDIGHQYFHELRSRSFFDHYIEHRRIFGVYVFTMHDLIHDLALLVAEREFLLVKPTTKSIPEKIRHLSFKFEDPQQCLPFSHTISNSSDCLRSVMNVTRPESLGKMGDNSVPYINPFDDMCIPKFKYLRYLNFSNLSFEAIPSHFGSHLAKHLRFLDLSVNDRLKRLPNSICELQSLQALALTACEQLEELPKDIRNLVSLTFLSFTTNQIILPENGVGCLSSLRFLGIVNCINLRSLCKDIGNLKALRMLTIVGCNSLVSLPHGIRCLSSLETLVILNCKNLILTDQDGGEGEEDDNQSKKNMRIQDLSFEELPGLVALPQWLNNAAHSLQRIEITGCRNFTRLPQWLPKLACLETLELRYCPLLSALPAGVNNLKALKVVHIWECGELSKRCMPDGEDRKKLIHVHKVFVW